MRLGRPIVAITDADRENEGGLVIDAEPATTEWIAIMIVDCRGLICVPMIAARAAELDLPPMSAIAPKTSHRVHRFT
jgi:3,4-dihydroxy 2-butanone 4-phosphate synthase/GTP cyclohydrolase II